MVARFLAAGQGQQRLWLRNWGYWLIWKSNQITYEYGELCGRVILVLLCKSKK